MPTVILNSKALTAMIPVAAQMTYFSPERRLHFACSENWEAQKSDLHARRQILDAQVELIGSNNVEAAVIPVNSCSEWSIWLTKGNVYQLQLEQR